MSLHSLVARDVAKSYGDHVVLDGVDVVATPGLPLGMVGENGAGKSTLLRLLAGVEPADSGSISVPEDLGYLPQEPQFREDSTIGDVLSEALAPLHDAVRRLEARASDLEDPAIGDEYAALLDWAILHDAWDADRRAERAAARLGLGSLEAGRPVAAMSGGERSRLALAALIARRPTCVLLDEPTNHLDDDAIAFVEEFLTALPGVVVVASHDRTFLDNVCKQVMDLDRSWWSSPSAPADGFRGSRYTGGFSSYLDAKRAARQRWEGAFLTRQDELNGLRDAANTTARRVAHNRPPPDNDNFIYGFKGAKVAKTVSRRVRDTERRIEVLERERIPKPPKPISFDGVLASPGGSGRVVQVRDLVVPGRLSLSRLDVDAGEHQLVTGANGSGKSTLLKVLAGQIAPSSGTASVSAREVGYLPQEVTFRRPDLTPQQMYDALTVPAAGRAATSDGRAATSGGRACRDHSPILASLGLLHPRDLNRPVGVLSVGQQRRLALAILVAQQPDLLLLDEPTNHISLALAEELEEALKRSPGTVIVASHDRWLRRRWNGDARHLNGTRAQPGN